MKKITITTQDELDALKEDIVAHIVITGNLDRITKHYPNAVVDINGNAQISNVDGNAQISYVYGNAQISNEQKKYQTYTFQKVFGMS